VEAVNAPRKPSLSFLVNLQVVANSAGQGPMTYCAPIYDEIVRSAGIVMPEWKSDPVAQAELRLMATAYVRDLTRLERDKDSAFLSRRRLHRLTQSSGSYCCAVVRAAQRKGETLSLAEIKKRAACLDARRPVLEAVKVRAKHKSSGGYRFCVVSGLQRTALQVFGRDLISALHTMPACEFASRKRGRNSAISTLIAGLNESDQRDLVIGDLEGFFGAISRAHLDRVIHLPAAMRRAMFFIEEGAAIELNPNIKNDAHIEALNSTVRTGLPQGSLASPFAAALVMADLMKDVSAQPALTYVDDFAIRASASEEAETIISTLHSRSKAHPAGPLVFKQLHAHRLNDKNVVSVFLGYQLKEGLNGKVRAKPCKSAFDKFLARLARRLMAIPFQDLESTARRHADDWMRVQHAADWNEIGVDTFLGQASQVASNERQMRMLLPTFVPVPVGI
jgi:hypothetical protein